MATAIEKSMRLNCSPAEAFRLLVDNERLAYWTFSDRANVEPRVGGSYEIFWGTQGDVDSTEGCKILALEENRSLKVQWKGPTQRFDFAFMNAEGSLTTVNVSLSAIDGGTELHLQHEGFQDGEDWDTARAFLSEAWDGWLAELQQASGKSLTDEECRLRRDRLVQAHQGLDKLSDAELEAVAGGGGRRKRFGKYDRKPGRSAKLALKIKDLGFEDLTPGPVTTASF